MVNKMVLPKVCFNRTECTLVFIISWVRPCMLLLHAILFSENNLLIFLWNGGGPVHHQYLVFMNLRLYMVPHHLKSVITSFKISYHSLSDTELVFHFICRNWGSFWWCCTWALFSLVHLLTGSWCFCMLGQGLNFFIFDK